MKSTVLLLLTVLSSSTWAIEDFFEKYTFAKVMTKCFGNESYINFLSQVNRAKRECSRLNEWDLIGNSGNGLSTFLQTFRPRKSGRPQSYDGNDYLNLGTIFGLGNDRRRGSGQLLRSSDFRGQSQSFANDRLGSTTESSFIVVADDTWDGTTIRPLSLDRRRPNSNPGFVYDGFTGPRRINPYTYDDDYLSDAIHNVRAAILNFTCVLQSLDIIDNAYNINYRTVVNTFIEGNVLDYRLRQDLSDGINYCREAMTCIPETYLPIPLELQRLLEFMKCEKRTRLMSCFRQDLRQNLQLFDLSALPEDRGRRAYLENLMAVVMGTDLLEDSEFF